VSGGGAVASLPPGIPASFPPHCTGFAGVSLKIPPASIDAKYRYLSEHLADRQFLLDDFSIADAYLVTTLGWAQPAGIDLSAWPVLGAYASRLRERPTVARAIGEELKLAGRG